MPRRTQDLRESLFNFIYGAVTLYGLTFQKGSIIKQIYHSHGAKSYNPNITWTLVWANPLSLATTQGIISFPEVTKMFQFTSFPLLLYVFKQQY